MKFKKIRKIFRIIFPKVFSNQEIFENKIRSNSLISKFEKEKDIYKLEINSFYVIYIRGHEYSDLRVFEQIFNNQEYGAVLNLMLLNPIFFNEKIIIDAGANIGCTSVFFSNYFPSSKIVLVEPSIDNFKILKLNINSSKNNNDFILYNNALAERPNKFFNLGRDFRDGTDWSITTEEDAEGLISGITLNQIIVRNELKYITLLKIDIEGAERFIFKEGVDLSFLKITQIIAVEIHDEFIMRDVVFRILKEHDFLIFDVNETTIGINQRIIK